MDAKRWSPLWVFVGGCLTGAALIGMHSRAEPESASNSQRAGGWSDGAPSQTAGSVDERVHADPDATDVATRGQGEARPSGAANSTAASATDTAARDSAEAGNSVAEVLARLETEYRQRSAPPQPQAEALPVRDEPARALSNEQPPASAQAHSASSGASGPKLPASEHSAVVRVAAADAEAPPSNARLSISLTDGQSTPSVAEDVARLASIREDQAQAFDRGQQQLAQMQQVAALQQAALAEQFTLLQLQLLTLSSTSHPPAPTRSQRRVRGGRIVASLPSSISDTDNPWGFDLQPSVLVR